MRIMGLDISTVCTGWCLLDTGNKGSPYVASGFIKHKDPIMTNRFLVLNEELGVLLKMYDIQNCIIEKPIFFLGKHASAQTVAVCHEVYGVALFTLAYHNVPNIIEQHPATTKSKLKIKRDAPKKEAIHMTVRVLLPEARTIKSQDELDALGLALSVIIRPNGTL